MSICVFILYHLITDEIEPVTISADDSQSVYTKNKTVNGSLVFNSNHQFSVSFTLSD